MHDYQCSVSLGLLNIFGVISLVFDRVFSALVKRLAGRRSIYNMT